MAPSVHVPLHTTYLLLAYSVYWYHVLHMHALVLPPVHVPTIQCVQCYHHLLTGPVLPKLLVPPHHRVPTLWMVCSTVIILGTVLIPWMYAPYGIMHVPPHTTYLLLPYYMYGEYIIGVSSHTQHVPLQRYSCLAMIMCSCTMA
jgi:hypothetical protein